MSNKKSVQGAGTPASKDKLTENSTNSSKQQPSQEQSS